MIQHIFVVRDIVIHMFIKYKTKFKQVFFLHLLYLQYNLFNRQTLENTYEVVVIVTISYV